MAGPSADRRDQSLARVQRRGIEFVEFANSLDDLADRRIGSHPGRKMLQGLPRLNLNHRQLAGNRR